MSRLNRLSLAISSSEPSVLEGLIRGLLIHYFFHISNKSRIFIINTLQGESPTLNVLTPTMFKGFGAIHVGNNVVFGVSRSPGSYECSYIESRTSESLIEIGDGTVLNNRAVLISEGAYIRIGKGGLFGYDVHIFDSNHHSLQLGKRHLADQSPQGVSIGDDVFIGARVTILKGVRIGNGCVISAGSVLPPGFNAPPNSTIAGNPAQIIRNGK